MKTQKTFFRKCLITLLIGIFLLSTDAPTSLAGEIVHFYHNDHLGSPLAMTDEDGSVVWRRDYFPFGQEIDPGGETTFNPHTFTGKEFDAETGLYYYGARYYDPVIGRFISVDPAGSDPSDPQSWNRYVYTLNNPYKYVDPDGEIVWDVIDFACFGYSTYRFIDDPSWSTALDLGLDAAGLLPVVPALGTIKRAGTLLQKAAKADEVLDAAKIAKPTGRDWVTFLRKKYGKENVEWSSLKQLRKQWRRDKSKIIGAWEEAHDKKWPKTADGKPYIPHHDPALSEGGTIWDIKPIHPAEHAKMHAGGKTIKPERPFER